MGFDFNKYDSGGAYVKAPEKKRIAEDGIPFQIVSVDVQDDNVYKGEKKPRFVLNILVPDPETGDEAEKKLTFDKGSGVDSRDNMLQGLAEYLDGSDAEDVFCKLELVGRAYVLRQAD